MGVFGKTLGRLIKKQWKSGAIDKDKALALYKKASTIESADDPLASEIFAASGLSPDEVARQYRAASQGFGDDVLYHGSKQDISELRPKYDDGMTFLTTEPEFASKWIEGTGGIRDRKGGKSGKPFIEKEIADERARVNEVADWDRIERETDAGSFDYYDSLKAKQKELNKISGVVDGALYPVRTKGEIFDPSKQFDEIKPMLLDLNDQGLTDIINDGRGEAGYWGVFERPEVRDWLQNEGYSGIRLSESTLGDAPLDTVAMIDQSAIRSTNAAFDPAKKHSSRLLDSLAPMGVGTIAAAGALAPEEAEASFVGEGAQGIYKGIIKAAKALDAKGIPREDIWKQTHDMGGGAYLGPDGKWRVEVDDSGADVTERFYDAMADGRSIPTAGGYNHPALLDAYPQVGHMRMHPAPEGATFGGRYQGRNPYTNELPKTSYNTSSLVDDYGRSIVAHENQHAIQDIEGFQGGSSPDASKDVKSRLRGKAGQASNKARRWAEDNPEAGWRAKQLDEGATPFYFYESASKLRNYANSPEPTRQKRKITGFGNVLHDAELRDNEAGKELYRRLYAMPKNKEEKTQFLRDWANDAANLFDSVVPDGWRNTFDDEVASRGSIEKLRAARNRKIASSRKELRELDRLEQSASDAADFAEDARNATDLEVYMRSGGEVEARNVQRRLDMSPDERRNNPAWKTEDRPPRQQIFNSLLMPGAAGVLTAGALAPGDASAGAIFAQDGGQMPEDEVVNPWFTKVSNAVRGGKLLHDQFIPSAAGGFLAPDYEESAEWLERTGKGNRSTWWQRAKTAADWM